MANTKITGLPTVVDVASNTWFETSTNGVSGKANTSQLQNFFLTVNGFRKWLVSGQVDVSSNLGYSNVTVVGSGGVVVTTNANTQTVTFDTSGVYALANTSNTVLPIAFGVANVGSATAVAAFGAANTAQATGVAAFGTANTALTTGVAAFAAANVGSTTAIAAFGAANTAQATGVAAFGTANTALTTGVAAFDAANTAQATGVAAFGAANTAQATGVAAFAKANSALANASGTFNGNLTVAGTLVVSTNTILGNLAFSRLIAENANIAAYPADANIQFNLLNSVVEYWSNNATSNCNVNFRGNSTTTLDNTISVGQSVTCAFLMTNGASPKYFRAFQVDGAVATVKWVGGAPTSGTANSIESYAFTIIKTGAAAYQLIASKSAYV
jgi:hypothetical protein